MKIARGEQFQIHEVLCRIGYFGLLCISRTVSYRQSVKNCPGDSFLPGQFHILYRPLSTVITQKLKYTCRFLRFHNDFGGLTQMAYYQADSCTIRLSCSTKNGTQKT